MSRARPFISEGTFTFAKKIYSVDDSQLILDNSLIFLKADKYHNTMPYAFNPHLYMAWDIPSLNAMLKNGYQRFLAGTLTTDDTIFHNSEYQPPETKNIYIKPEDVQAFLGKCRYFGCHREAGKQSDPQHQMSGNGTELRGNIKTHNIFGATKMGQHCWLTLEPVANSTTSKEVTLLQVYGRCEWDAIDLPSSVVHYWYVGRVNAFEDTTECMYSSISSNIREACTNQYQLKATAKIDISIRI